MVYLGVAWIKIDIYNFTLKFDVTTAKINYEIEYRSMVEAIAAHCQQLLLDWGSPTTLSFVSDAISEKKILLEQFLFLRHTLSPGRLDFYLEMIQRNPHSHLVTEENWRPIGAGISSKFFRDPLRVGRDWLKVISNDLTTVNGYLPEKTLVSRKFESYDTPPNRFVKFALEAFQNICQQVIAHPHIQGAAMDEALAMLNTLNQFLSYSFFEDVKQLNQVPLNNQVLQKREGYQQLLSAWLLVDAATQLDWPGREDAYDGNNRNVPKLYEYWLYFSLYQILLKGGLQLVQNEPSRNNKSQPFIDYEQNGLTISLKEGKTSHSIFSWQTGTPQALRVHLFYNRDFKPEKPANSVGSYSLGFNPDYTLVIFPEILANSQNWEENENRAMKEGKIAFLHFDAKYRVEKLEQFFGRKEDRSDPGIPVTEESQEIKKTDISDTFKRDDLYKMHTYNEAIRRTIGSYVLYPGTDDLQSKKHLFKHYHEILPGVGAFVMRPSYIGEIGSEHTVEGEEILSKFITDVLKHQQSKFTQAYRIAYYTQDTIKYNLGTKISIIPISQQISRNLPNEDLPATDIEILLVYTSLNPKIGDIISTKYYIDAVKNGDLSISSVKYIIGYNNGYTLNECWSVKECYLQEKSINRTRYIGSKKSRFVPHFVFVLEKFCEIEPISILSLVVEQPGEIKKIKWNELVSQKD